MYLRLVQFAVRALGQRSSISDSRHLEAFACARPAAGSLERHMYLRFDIIPRAQASGPFPLGEEIRLGLYLKGILVWLQRSRSSTSDTAHRVTFSGVYYYPPIYIWLWENTTHDTY